MDTLAAVNDLLNVVGGKLGLDLQLDEARVCALQYDGDLSCSIEAPTDDSVVIFHASLLAVTADGREQLLENALALNLFGRQTSGCFLALDGDRTHLVLCYTRSIDGLTPDLMEVILGNFLRTAVNVREQLGDSADGATTADLEFGENERMRSMYLQV